MAVSVVGMMRDLEPRRGSFGDLAAAALNRRDLVLGQERQNW